MLVIWKYFNYTCMDVWPSCMSVYHMCTWFLHRLEEAIRSPEARAIDGCRPSDACWGLNTSPLAGQSIPLTAEPSLYPLEL